MKGLKEWNAGREKDEGKGIEWMVSTPVSTPTECSMASNQKVEENRPPLKFNFTYWEVFSSQFYDCENVLWTCLIFSSVQLSSIA